MEYGITDDGVRFWSLSYSAYGGNWAYLSPITGWSKLPVSWKTREGAERWQRNHPHTQNYRVEVLPYTANEKRELLHKGAAALLKAAKFIRDSHSTSEDGLEITISKQSYDELMEAVAKAEGREP